jgi:hypothetical protein
MAAAWEAAPVIEDKPAATERPAWMDAPEVTPPEVKPQLSPTDGMSTTEKVVAGYGKAGVDLVTGLKQRWDDAAAWLEGNMPFADALNQKIGGKTAAQVRDEGRAAEDERKRLDAPLMATTAGRIGNVLGNVVNAVPTLAIPGANTVVGSAMIGAGAGAAQPTGTDDSAVLNAGIGAGLGAGVAGVLKGAAKVAKPAYDSAVNKLLDLGIPLTPGQMLGGAWKRIEEAATSIPFAGDAIRNSQRRAFQALNTAVGNEALAPIGATLPKGLSGHEAVQWTRKALNGAYDDVLQRIGAVQADDAFASQVGNLRQMVSNGNLAEESVKRFDRILENQVLGRFQGQEAITAQTLKKMESELGNLSQRLGRSQNYDDQLLGDAVEELQGSLRGLVQRSAGPKEAADLQAANAGWAMFTRMRRAASMVGAEDGVFTPAQFLNATKAMDKSTQKGAFAEGRALGQDLAEAAKSVMGQTVPDSGTPLRMLVQHPIMGMSGVPISAAYTQPAQSAIRTLMTARPPAAGPISRALEKAVPLSGGPGSRLLTGLSPGNGQE